MQADQLKLKREAHWPQAVLGATAAVLIVVGIGGSIYRMLEPGGWFARAVAGHLSGWGALGAGVSVLAVLCWVGREWISPGARNRVTDAILIAAASAGAIYIAQWSMGAG